MTFDPEAHVYVVPLPKPVVRRRSRRHVVLGDPDWVEVGDGARKGTQLRASICLNGVWADLVLSEIQDDYLLDHMEDVVIEVRGQCYVASLATASRGLRGAGSHGTRGPTP